MNRGKSTGTSQQFTGRELLTPDEVMRLGPEHPIVLVRGERPYLLDRLNYLADADCALASPRRRRRVGGAAEGGGRAQPSHRGGDFATGAKRREDGGAARPREVSGGGVATLPVFGSGAPRFFTCFFLFFRARARGQPEKPLSMRVCEGFDVPLNCPFSNRKCPFFPVYVPFFRCYPQLAPKILRDI